MASAGVWQSLGPIVCVVMLTTPSVCRGQSAALTPADPGPETALAATSTPRDERWEVTLDGRVGFPIGRLKVGEFPTGANKLAGGGSPGTAFRLHDLGIEVSEALEGSVAFHFTPGDAVRVSYLYYFLDGRTTLHHSVFYNGPEFTPGSLSTNADYYRLSLDYERTLLSRPSGDRLIGGVGLTYVNLNPTLTGNSPSASAEGSRGSNSEDFYRQELPVPILGIRWDHPLGPRLLLRTRVAGGGLPRVDSLRKEGGTIYLRQSHADADARLAYVLGRHAEVEVGYHFTYFFQEEKSHEDKNVFELIDNGFQLGLRVWF